MSSGVRSTNVSVLRESMLSNKLTLAEVFDSYIKNRIVSDEINDSRLGRSKTDIDILPFSLEELRYKCNQSKSFEKVYWTKKTRTYTGHFCWMHNKVHIGWLPVGINWNTQQTCLQIDILQIIHRMTFESYSWHFLSNSDLYQSSSEGLLNHQDHIQFSRKIQMIAKIFEVNHLVNDRLIEDCYRRANFNKYLDKYFFIVIIQIILFLNKCR